VNRGNSRSPVLTLLPGDSFVPIGRHNRSFSPMMSDSVGVYRFGFSQKVFFYALLSDSLPPPHTCSLAPYCALDRSRSLLSWFFHTGAWDFALVPDARRPAFGPFLTVFVGGGVGGGGRGGVGGWGWFLEGPFRRM